MAQGRKHLQQVAVETPLVIRSILRIAISGIVALLHSDLAGGVDHGNRIDVAEVLLQPAQALVMIPHPIRPFRLPEIFTKMCNYGIEPKRMRLVHPYADKEPNMVLIEGLKGGKPRLAVDPPLIVYTKDGEYTEEVLKLYGMK